MLAVERQREGFGKPCWLLGRTELEGSQCRGGEVRAGGAFMAEGCATGRPG